MYAYKNNFIMCFISFKNTTYSMHTYKEILKNCMRQLIKMNVWLMRQAGLNHAPLAFFSFYAYWFCTSSYFKIV